MRFGSTPIPGELFKLARDRMLREASFTPEDIRTHLLSEGTSHLSAVTTNSTNQWIIAERVMQSARKDLAEAGEVAQLRRGVWMRSDVLKAAESQVEDQARSVAKADTAPTRRRTARP